MSNRDHALTVGKLIGFRSNIVLNLRRIQLGQPPSNNSGAIIEGGHERHFINHPDLIDPTIHLLAKLRFSTDKITPDQAARITDLMRNHYLFAWRFRLFVVGKRNGNPAIFWPDNVLYEVLYKAMSKDGLEGLILE